MNRVWRIARLGLTSLLHHPLRSGLATLGIVLGVASVIAMLAIGEGASELAQANIRALGSDTIRVFSQKPTDGGGGSQQRSRMVIYGLDYNDVHRIKEALPGVDVIVPVREVSQTIYYGSKRSDTSALGTEPGYLGASRQQIDRGRWFTEVDMWNQGNCTVLGAALARKLFDHLDPLGEFIRIGTKPFVVIGVLSQGPDTTKLNQKQVTASDDAAFIPLTTIRERWGNRNIKRSAGSMDIEEVEIHQLVVRAQDSSQVPAVAQAIRSMLERFHKKGDWKVAVPLELLEQAERTRRMFNIVLGSIAGISLVVGGIGIMNIMLATVTERTREIGIRRALGARRRDITLQFLTEALVLSVVGGAVGVVLGLGVPGLVTHFNPDMPTLIVPESVVLSFGISAGVGIVFGIYPAMRAARLDPIVALRHE